MQDFVVSETFLPPQSASVSMQVSNVRQPPQQINYRPNVVMTDNSKKSYNYMASPNYLQYENTYQKYKNMCHNKDVTNFRENSLSHREHRSSDYRDENTNEYGLDQRFTNVETKAENTMQSSDDDGGFKQNAMFTKNQFNHNASVNSSNITNGNIGYSTKEIEPLLHGGHHIRESIQMSSHGQKYEPPHYANPAAMMAIHNMQKQQAARNSNSIENQHVNRCHHNRYNQQNQYQYQHKAQSPYRKVPPPPAARPYTKPLPKLPMNIGEFQ